MSEDDATCVRLAIEQALSREAHPAEIDRGLALLEQLESNAGLEPDRALELFALGLFNRNEFLWLD